MKIRVRLLPPLRTSSQASSSSSSSTPFLSVDVDDESTIEEVRRRIHALLSPGFDVDRIRLTTERGRIMRCDEDVLSDYGLVDDALVFASLLPATTTSPVVNSPTTRTNSQETDMLASMMNNPFMQSMMSNPDFVRTIIQANPQIQGLIRENPEMAAMFEDSRFINQMSEVMRNPSMMNEMKRQMDRSMLHIENLPGGMDALQRMFSTIDTADAVPRMGREEEARRNRELAERYQVQPVPQDHVNDQALPNPWAPPPQQPPQTVPTSLNNNMPFAGMDSMFSMLGLNGTNQSSQPPMPMFNPFMNNPFAMFQPPAMTNTPQSAANANAAMNPFSLLQNMFQLPTNTNPPQQPYQEQMDRLLEMGFVDVEKNRRALTMANGDLDEAITLLDTDFSE